MGPPPHQCLLALVNFFVAAFFLPLFPCLNCAKKKRVRVSSNFSAFVMTFKHLGCRIEKLFQVFVFCDEGGFL
jgi:hypothetical protein